MICLYKHFFFCFVSQHYTKYFEFGIGILCSSNHYIDWSEASKQCKSKYDSELISEQYIATENLTEDIIQELGFNIAAWIDGKEQELGCRNGNGFIHSFATV